MEKLDYLVETLLDRLDDYTEAKQKLDEARSEYTGYSPCYHLASWMDAKDYARKEFAKVFKESVMEAHN